MKEARFFYVPDAALRTDLPSDEVQHAVRVLRLTAGDEVFLMVYITSKRRFRKKKHGTDASI